MSRSSRVRDRRQILAEREARAQRRLDVRHQQRGADALAGHVADEQRDLAAVEHEVVEEVAADFARRHRDALDLGQPETQRRLRQHVVLDLPAELELAADALLLDRGALCRSTSAAIWLNAVASWPTSSLRSHFDARAVVALRDAVDAVAERRQVARQPRRQRHDADEREADETEAESRRCARSCGAGPSSESPTGRAMPNLSPEPVGSARRHDDPVRLRRRAGRRVGQRDVAERLDDLLDRPSVGV